MTRLLLLTALLATAAFAQQMPVSTSSDEARTQFALGVTALGHIANDRAVEHFDAALAADPDFVQAHLYRAIASADGRDGHLRLAAAGRASDAEHQLVAAYQARHRGDHARQLALLTDLTEQFPDDPVLWLRLANAQAIEGDAAAAAVAARRGIAADRSYAPLRHTLGHAETALGNLLEADAAFRSYIRLAPDEANPYDSYSEFLLAVGRFDMATMQYERAIALDPTFDPDRRGLARIGIARSSARLEQAVANRDVDALAALYAEDAVIMPPDSPPIRGREAIREYLARFVASGQDGFATQSAEVVLFDDVAIERADLTMSTGEQVEEGKSLSVWTLVGDEWLCVRTMWSLNGDLAGATP